MAEHGAMEVDTATGVDYDDHRRMYLAFLRILRWSIVGIVLILAFLAFTTSY